MIGVIGGMGPLATADFFTKVIEVATATSAATADADHVPLLIHSVPQLPSRTAAILAGGESPLPALRAVRDRLLNAGAIALAMPCNTAHYWYDALTADCRVPFLHIVDAVCDELASTVAAGATVGIIATRATLVSRVYHARLEQRGYRIVVPNDETMASAVLPSIDKVKAGATVSAGNLLEPVVAALLAGTADAMVLACTETPLALAAIESPLAARCVDSNLALARACVRWWKESRR